MRFLTAASSLVIAAILLTLTPRARAKDEKLTPEQLVAKHLASLGSPDKVKEIKTRTTTGITRVNFPVRGVSLNGLGNTLSDETSIRIVFRFPAQDYPGEALISNGSKAVIGQISPGKRSQLGKFVFDNDYLLREGILFGSLSTSWALLNTAARQPRLEVTGIKKVNGRSLYEMKYFSKKTNGNLEILMYFDPETFRHLETRIKGDFTSAGVTETFDDFKEVDGITLPHLYKIDLSGAASWTYTVQQVSHNQPVDQQVFQ